MGTAVLDETTTTEEPQATEEVIEESTTEEDVENTTEATDDAEGDDRLCDIRIARARVGETLTEWERQKKITNAAKADYDAAVQDLLDTIDDQDQMKLSFTASPSSDGEKPEADAWRNVEISDLKLGTKNEKALRDAELDTLGKLADFTSTGKRFDSVTGVGSVGADDIDEALTQWWAAHPEYLSKGDEPAEGDDAADTDEAVEASEAA
ncbi:MAG: hypothetical protein AAF432_00570 [Planctomycetota bacterium]